ncbi:hypothetical protein BJY04DRAFT_98301 [Aspergillus karnatakaensis]|uniref:uncharacterized protein n=1 Tax=Aspergillus karnatakaensis TaxID=1810916 RepID=UPI003CCD0726
MLSSSSPHNAPSRTPSIRLLPFTGAQKCQSRRSGRAARSPWVSLVHNFHMRKGPWAIPSNCVEHRGADSLPRAGEIRYDDAGRYHSKRDMALSHTYAYIWVSGCDHGWRTRNRLGDASQRLSRGVVARLKRSSGEKPNQKGYHEAPRKGLVLAETTPTRLREGGAGKGPVENG